MDDALETALELFRGLPEERQPEIICLVAYLASQQ